MKKTLLSTVGIIFFVSLFFSCTQSGNSSQESQKSSAEPRLLKLHYENSSGENGLTTFDYHPNGTIHMAVWELTDGSRNSLNFYDYNEEGNLVRKYREFSDSLTSSQTYEYDAYGNLITENFERSDGITGVTYYEYDEKGRLMKADCQGLNGWFHGLITYEYNEDGQKVKGHITQKGQPTGTIVYSYDEHGYLQREHWDFSGKWSQTFVREYEVCGTKIPEFYTSSNVFIDNSGSYRISKEDYDFSNQTGGPSLYTYDEDGKLIQKRFVRSDGLSTTTFFLYDCDGNLAKSYRKYSNGRTAVFSYEFNKDRKLIRRSYKRTDGVQGNESYEYDENSRLVKAHYDNFDSWLTGTITFSYDKKNHLTEGFYEGANGTSAKIFFTYSENQNLEKIHWDFSFDRTQTYTFSYEKTNDAS